MSIPEDNIFSVDAITGSERSTEAVRHDFEEQIASLENGSPEEQQALLLMKKAEALGRMVSFGVLSRLDGMGVEDAKILADKLKSIDPEQNPLAADMSAVAFAYDEEREANEDSGQRRRLKELGSLAHAVFSIATFQAVRATVTAESHSGQMLYGYAEQSVEVADIPDNTRTALSTILDEVQSTITSSSPKL